MKTLMELDEGKNNNFDVIRFVAASLVIFSHAYAVSGHPGEEPLAGKSSFITFGSLAVEIFFVISGYLVTQSLMRQRHLLTFAEARCLRIFPALIVCCALSAFLMGPLATSLPIGAYFTDHQTWLYFVGNASLTNLQWFLPSVFDKNTLKGVVNGSLWTLPTEFKMYIVVFVFGLLTLLFKRWRQQLIGCVALGYIVYCFSTQSAQLADHTQADPRVLVVLFLFGMVFHAWRAIVPISATLAVLLWGALLLLRGTSLASLIYYIALTYSIFVIAFDENFRLHHFAKHGDFSYGLYLYGFPVKQMVAFTFGAMGATSMFLIAFPITLLFAWLSWRYVEAPSLKRKGTLVSLMNKLYMKPQGNRST
jgi:peptidoglycan/LPS O-acetylase OafA/YrhL